MTVRDVKLPEDIERGVQGGPGFKTDVSALVSGHEKRNVDWSRTRGEWDAAYGIQTKADMEAVLDLFYASFGMAYGFRFKDWSDFNVGVDATDTPQALLPVGDGVETEFQCIKRYQAGAFFHDRVLTRLVADPAPRVFVDAVEQTITTHYTIDLNTGIISMVTPPAAAEVVGVIAQFDVPVRFGTDRLNISMQTFDAGNLPAIPLTEIREGP
jgi:uncharacterized protein (TIGR02217 family)